MITKYKLKCVCVYSIAQCFHLKIFLFVSQRYTLALPTYDEHAGVQCGHAHAYSVYREKTIYSWAELP